MAKKVAFVGFGTVQDTDSQRVADVLGVEKNQQLGFFDSINDAAQFVVTKVEGKITAIEGSEVYVSADADDDTISKARRIRSVGVAVNLDWEPFKRNFYSDSALRSWVSDGEWIEDDSAEQPFVVPSYVDETEQVAPAPVSDEDFPTQPYTPEDVRELALPDAYAPEEPIPSFAPPTFEAPVDIAPLPVIPIENSGYADAPQYAEEPTFEAPQFEPPQFEAPYAPADGYAAPVESQYSNEGYATPEYTDEAPQFDPPQFEAPQFEIPVVAEEPSSYLEDAQEQAPAPAPMASFLQVQPVQEEPQYEEQQYAAPDQYAAPEYQEGGYEEPRYEQPYAAPAPEYQNYEAPQYEAPIEQYGAPQYEAPAPQYEAPAEYTEAPQYSPPATPPSYAPPVQEPAQYGGYTPPTPEAPFIQHSPYAAPEPTPYQRERAMFEHTPAGQSNDFESRTGGKIVYVTGSHGGAGKTTTAWTLASLVAVSMKKAGNEDTSVWLIESDYRNSKLAQRHNIDPDRTSGHLASMLEWLNDQSGIVDNLPARKAQAIANSTHRLENGLNIIACPYDTTKRDTKYIQQAVFQAAQYARMQGGIVFIDADTISNDDIMDSKLAKAADRVVIVSDAGTEHIDDLKRAARILTTPVVSGGLGVAMPAITVLLNKTGPNEFKDVEDSGVLAPLALGGYLPFIPEWATGWVGSLTNTDTFQNAVVLFARFFNGIVPLQELHQWANYRATGVSKKNGGGWVRRIFSSRKAK